MKKRILLAALGAMCGTFTAVNSARAQGTAFTYQGQLQNNGSVASGSYDLMFTLYANNTTGAVIAGPVTNLATAVTGGLFTVTINFGGVFTGTNYWLDIAVRTNGGAGFADLTPRQPLTPVPYAIFANTASNLSGTVSGALVSGAIANNNLPASPTFSGTVTAGNLAGNGAGVTNVNAAALNGLNATSFWQLEGNNVAAGNFLGSTNFQPVQVLVNGSRALWLAPTTNNATHSNIVNVVGGAPVNYVQPGTYGAVIAGGGAVNYNGNLAYSNSVFADMSSIGGGGDNLIQGNSTYSVLGGGFENVIQTNSAFSMVAGGYENTIQPNAGYSVLGGGYGNSIQTNASYSFLGSGQYNSIQPNSTASVIGGGYQNTIQASASDSVIGGGYYNSIQASASFSFLGGGYDNVIQTNSPYSVLVGGEDNAIREPYTSASFLGGGINNVIQTGANVSVLVGGTDNNIQTNASTSFLGGGYNNNILTGAGTSVIVGGSGNSIQANAAASVIVGGVNNVIQPGAAEALIVGGQGNAIQTGSDYSVLGGGLQNSIQQPYTGYSVLVGGAYNSILPNLFYADYAVLGGGYYNTNGGSYSVVPGGTLNYAAGEYSFAAGQRAKANYQGDFVWADSEAADFNSTTNDQFLIRAQGGVGINKTNPASALDVAGTINATSFAGNGAGLTSLQATNLVGALPSATLPAGVVTNNENGVTLGNLNVNGTFTLPTPAIISWSGIGGAVFYVDNNYNTLAGQFADFSGSPGQYNTGIGALALFNCSGNFNTALGEAALGVISGSNNIAIGHGAGGNTEIGNNDIYIGNSGLNGVLSSESGVIRLGTPGIQTNTVIAGVINGNGAGLTNLQLASLPSAVVTNGESSLVDLNTLFVSNLLLPLPATISVNESPILLVDANANSYFGLDAGLGDSGINNTGIGGNTFTDLTGNNNIALGYNAGSAVQTGNNNIYIGNAGVPSESGIIHIGGNQTDEYLAGTVHATGGVNVDHNSQNTGTLTANALTFGSGSGEGIASKRIGSNNDDLEFYTGFNQQMTILHSGQVGIATSNPSQALEINGEFAMVDGLGGVKCYIGDDGIGNDVQVGSQTSGVTDVTLFNTADNAYMHINCSSITIEGGSDLAEPFKMSALAAAAPQGAVVVIDAQNPGQLKLSDSPYDTRVAGVVSGANGINPGIQMHQEGLLEGGRNVALTGRVYVQADASNGPIQPGDLLTTSSTPGHAMKITDHAKAAGAILGKAMTGLSAGQGMVLVLVTLQ